MSVGYRAVGWSRQKRIYDTVLAVGAGGCVAVFAALTFVLHPEATAETAIIRATSVTAFLLLHVILAIGPLARLDRRFLPLLYNRRHLGVTMFLLAFVHGAFALFQFHALGVLNPFVSVLVSDGSFIGAGAVPFQIFGVGALLILFLMAATSHDFWLHNLSAPVWKALHMLVYVAYALLVAHVAFGAAQVRGGSWLGVATALGAAGLVVLHLVAAKRESCADAEPAPLSDGWVDACALDEIPENRAKVVAVAGERVAIFRYEGKLSAVSSVCQHQNGPLGEGRVIAGCITCPWHGYQYVPATGASPAPFTERVATFAVRLQGRRVWIEARPKPAGTRVEPARITP